jgi:hypothetical protein
MSAKAGTSLRGELRSDTSLVVGLESGTAMLDRLWSDRTEQ